MKINQKILCIPPYISTPWSNISSLRSENNGDAHTLIISLSDKTSISIPDLNPTFIHAIFAAHAKFHDSTSGTSFEKAAAQTKNPLTSIYKLEGLQSIMEHNQADCEAPALPKDVLEKIAYIAQLMSQEEINAIPKPEPHCNCPHCQITRVFHTKDATDKSNNCEEIVSEEDLKFRSWDICQKAEELYEVINPLDAEERYNVFLGTPIGCTCGSKKCEHIKAVLSS
ncbi:MAG: hypothetical protein EBZ47_01335 [Chlamydiae bacterium]|nr:hypothetical protein [Chlamydiota bacterium]